MVRAIFLLAFHALLRLGEIVAISYADYWTILQRQDISISYKDGHSTSLFFTLRHYKTIKKKIKAINPYTFQLRLNQIYHRYVQCLQWIITLKYAGLHEVHYFNLGQVHQLHTSLFLPISQTSWNSLVWTLNTDPHWRCNSSGKPRFLRNLY
jgi:hypothetical protein